MNMILLPAIDKEFLAFAAEVHAAKADGKLSVGEALALIVDAVNRFIRVAVPFSVSGEEKKEAVIQFALHAFDVVVPYVKIPYLSAFVPSFVRNYVITQVRASLPAMLSTLIDKLYAALKPLLNPPIPQPSVN